MAERLHFLLDLLLQKAGIGWLIVQIARIRRASGRWKLFFEQLLVSKIVLFIGTFFS